MTGTLTCSVLTRVEEADSLEDALRRARLRNVLPPSSVEKSRWVAHGDTHWVVTCDLTNSVNGLLAVVDK